MPKFALSGSDRSPLAGARAICKADPNERLEVTLLVRHRDPTALKALVSKLAAGDKAASPLSREQFTKKHGADPTDIATIKAFAENNDLQIAQEDAARRTVLLSGTVAQFNAAFGVDLRHFEHAGGSYRGRTGPVHLPMQLKEVVEAVLGLDNRPVAAPHFRHYRPAGQARGLSDPAASTSYTPTQMASIYNFPAGDGGGQCIALIELGGGYRLPDLRTYFSKLGVAVPKVASVSVDHANNQPTGDPNGPDGEVMLDLEVAGAVAPGAKLVVYFAPNTDAGFLNAVTTAVHDTNNKPSVVSISWGGSESSWTAQAMTAFEQAFQAAATLGVTLCVASGDNGSSDGAADGQNHVNFPASVPYALACGGTRLQASGTQISSEQVWNDGAQGGASGGGESSFFVIPPWQEGLKATTTAGVATALSKRGVPDVAGDADPYTGYAVRVDGQDTVIGGTSAVAPLWAGLIARINAATGRPAGLVHGRLYARPNALHDITQGNNGDFAATPLWDACTGLGSPDGQQVAAAIGA